MPSATPFKNTVNHRKNPEQCQQDIISRKWNRSFSSEETLTTTTTTVKSVKNPPVSRFTTHLSIEQADDNVATDNFPNRAEKLKNTYESTNAISNTGANKFNNIVVNGKSNAADACYSNGAPTKMASRFNSNSNAGEDPFGVTLKPVSNGFRASSSSEVSSVAEKWKNEEPVVAESKRPNFQISRSKFFACLINFYRRMVFINS